MTRRHFLNRMVEALVWLAFGRWVPSVAGGAPPEAPGPSGRIAVVRHPGATDGSDGRDDVNLRETVVARMVREAVRSFVGVDSAVAAWERIIPDPTRKVAIKVNCQIEGVFTKASVVQPIVDGLVNRGVRTDDIFIYDMHDTAFRVAGFEPNTGLGVKVGTVEQFGGYGRFFYDRLANLLTGGYPNAAWNVLSALRGADASPVVQRLASSLGPDGPAPFDCGYLINVPVLKALDGYSGVSLSMKNHYGSIGNPAEHHHDIMEHIVRINGRPEIRGKTRLILLDALFGEYRWTNGRDQTFVDPVSTVVAGIDPVSIDHWGWEALEALRISHGLGPVEPAPYFLDLAEQAGLGVRRANRRIDTDLGV